MSSPATNPYDVIAGDLAGFTKFTYPGYQQTWHQDVIDEALLRVARGEIKRLALSVPPQKGKTEKTTIRFPAWLLANDPDKRIIINSYSADKAEDCSRQARDIVTTERFASLFPDLKLSKSSQSVTHWQFEGRRGYIHAVGTGGPVTGFGADLLILDDPIKDREEAESETVRESLWNWYTSVALTRLSPDAAVIVIHTRWNEDDLIGRLIAEQPHLWTYVNIPAVDEETGRIVWPEKWSRAQYDAVRAEVGESDWYALYQGQPYPPKGNIFDAAWFIISPRHPAGLKWYRCWDLANTRKKKGSFTVGAKIAIDESNHLWICDIIRGKWKWHEARQHILNVAHSDGSDVTVLIEKGAFEFAKFAQDIVDEWPDLTIPAYAVPVKGLGDKEARAQPWAALAARSGVTLVGSHTTPWIKGFLDRIPRFSEAAPETDEADAISLGFNEILKRPVKKHEQNQPKPLSPAWAAQRLQEQAAADQSIVSGNYIFE